MHLREFNSTLSLQRRALIAASMLAILLCVGGRARAEFKLTVDLKDGDKIHDIASIVAHADSSDGIDKVEFFVDDQLKSTVTGIPYVLKWDTIADTEGKHTLAITAYDANAQTKKLSISLVIDNEIPLGGEALAKKAHDALVAGDLDTALNYSRRSLKADPGNIGGSRVAASLAAKDSNWDKAASILEKANGYDTSFDAIRELAEYKLHKALLPENASSLASALQSIVELRQKSADMAVSAVKAKDPSAHEAIGDALLRAGNAKAAQQEYQKAGDAIPLTTSTRLALVCDLQDDTELATAFLRPLLADKIGDRTTRAVNGLTLLRKQKFAEARAAVAQDLGSGYAAAQVIAAYSDVVEGKPVRALQESELAIQLAPTAGDAHYVHSMAMKNLADSEAELIKAFSATPFATGPYLDYAARITLQKQSDRFEDALKLVDFVLTREPDNTGAKLVRSLMLLSKDRMKEVTESLDHVLRHIPAPDVKMVGAVYLTQAKQIGLANQYWDQARRADPEHFEFLVVPTPAQFLQIYVRKLHYRAGFYLSLESLFPAKIEAKPLVPIAPAPDPAQ